MDEQKSKSSTVAQCLPHLDTLLTSFAARQRAKSVSAVSRQAMETVFFTQRTNSVSLSHIHYSFEKYSHFSWVPVQKVTV